MEKIRFNGALAGQTVTLKARKGGVDVAERLIDSWGAPLNFSTAVQGRVNRLAPIVFGLDPAAEIVVTGQPARGRAYATADGALGLDLVGEFVRDGTEWQTGITRDEPFTVEVPVEIVTGAQSAIGTLTIRADADTQRRGWADGAHFQMPHVQGPGEAVQWKRGIGPVGWGPIHCTSGPSGWTLQMIADHAGVTLGTVTASWLLDRIDTYGATARPLARDAHDLLEVPLRNTASLMGV